MMNTVDEIKVGVGVTEYGYGITTPYEVVKVKDQKHISIRELDHKLAGEVYSNEWELISNENNTVYEVVKRGNYWYTEKIATLEDAIKAESDNGLAFWMHFNGFDAEKIKATGKPQKRYYRKNIFIGTAEYWHDYEF